MNWSLLQNSFLVSGLTTLLAAAFGLVAVMWFMGLESRWRKIWLAISAVALCLPPFLVTNCWLHYLGRGGVWHRWISFDIYSLGGTVLILSLLLWPITVFATLGAWRRLAAAQLESDTAVSGLHLLRGLLLPSARGALVQAGVLTFVLALNNFAVPAILQEKVFPAEVWVEFTSTYNVSGALQMCWPMVAVPLVLLVVFRRREIPWPRLTGSIPAGLFRRQLGGAFSNACAVITIGVVALSVGLPTFQLISSGRTWEELPGAIAAGQSAIWNSCLLAAGAAVLCIALGLLSWRLPIGPIVWLPFLVPGVLLGIGLITVFNRPAFSAFYQSAGIVILALTIRYLAFGWNGVAHALRGTDRNLEDAARLHGASRWQTFRHVHWPQISPQIAGVGYIIFLLCLWDVESIVLTVPPGGETLALRIFNLLHYGHNTQVNALCLTLLGLAIAPLLAWWLWSARAAVMGSRARAAAILCCAPVLLLTGCSRSNPDSVNIHSKIFSGVQIIGSRGTSPGQLNKPRSLALDKQDNLYVVDLTGRVQKFAADGQFLLGWQMSQTNYEGPKGMDCGKDGNIIVVEPHFQRINHYSPEGKQVAVWGDHGTNAGKLTMPRSVAVKSNGNLLITEYTYVERVQEFTHDGSKLINVFGGPGSGPGEFDRAEGVGVDSKDRIYVADCCNHRIQVFSPDGKFLRQHGKAGEGPGEFSYPYDVRVDESGRQYVCEFGNSRIQIFDASDHLIEVLGGPGSEPGNFSNPWAIALDSHGNLYVADGLNNRVQKFLRKPGLTAGRAGPGGGAA